MTVPCPPGHLTAVCRVMREQSVDLSEVPRGYCPNHSTGVTLPEGFVATPLQNNES